MGAFASEGIDLFKIAGHSLEIISVKELSLVFARDQWLSFSLMLDSVSIKT